jgi:hypothetical protein
VEWRRWILNPKCEKKGDEGYIYRISCGAFSTVSAAELKKTPHLVLYITILYLDFFHNRYDFLKYFLTKISAQNTDPISHGALYLIECVGLF